MLFRSFLLCVSVSCYGDVREFQIPFVGADGSFNPYNHNGNAHTGIDYSSVLLEDITSSGFGVVTDVFDLNVENNRTLITSTDPWECYIPGREGSGQQDWGGYNHLFSQHLINTGEFVYFKYLHFERDSISAKLLGGAYLVPGQFIAKEGASGCVTSEHLHFEVGKTKIPQRFNAEGLDSTYDPADFITNHSFKPALPLLSRVSTPSSGNYDVFGYADDTIYGHVNFTGTFNGASTVVRLFDDDLMLRSRVSQHGTLDDPLLYLGGTNDGVLVNGIAGNNRYGEGNYLFAGWIRHINNGLAEQRYGYPLKFSFVNQTQVIVDNDQLPLAQQNNDPLQKTQFVCQSPCQADKVPGYFLSALTFESELPQVARWEPKRRGKFSIELHMPDDQILGVPPQGEPDLEYQPLIYRICPKGGDSCVVRTLEQPEFGWFNPIKHSGSVEFFGFDQQGYIEVDSGYPGQASLVPVDAVKFTAYPAVWLNLKVRLGLSDNSAQKVYRDFMEHGEAGVEVSEGNVAYQYRTSTSGGKYSRYSINGKVAYINWQTGEVEGLIDCSDSDHDWYGAFARFLDRTGAPVCGQLE